MKETVIALILGTATPGGGVPLYGAAFADVVNAQEPRLRIEPRNTKGSTENVPLLESGKLDLALVAAEAISPSPARRFASSPRCIRRPACSSCAATARIARFPTCGASPW